MATVKTENAIRKVLSPTKRTLGEPIYLQRKSAEAMTGNAMLPSGFFAVKEMKNAEGKLTGVALYGGGNGHGVGPVSYTHLGRQIPRLRKPTWLRLGVKGQDRHFGVIFLR